VGGRVISYEQLQVKRDDVCYADQIGINSINTTNCSPAPVGRAGHQTLTENIFNDMENITKRRCLRCDKSVEIHVMVN